MKIPFIGGAYQLRNVVAEAQRCVNLYPEVDESRQGKSIAQLVGTPGLVSVVSALAGGLRALYQPTKGGVIAVAGNKAYRIVSDVATEIGTLTTSEGPVSVADDGGLAVLVDGPAGYYVNLETNAFEQIDSEAFYGADVVAYLDGYFIFNRPDTGQFYLLSSNFTGSFTGGVTGGSITDAGTGYYPTTPATTYYDVALTDGTGTGAKANLTVFGGTIRAVAVTKAGDGYGTDSLSAFLGGQIATRTLLSGGSGYVDGLYLGTPAINSGQTKGQNARASVTVAGGVVTAVSFGGGSQSFGALYQAGDLLTFTLPGGGSGVSVRVDTTADQGSGFSYVPTTDAIAFDPLDFATAEGSPDTLVSLIANHRELWLFGSQSVEIWYNSGDADFPFARISGGFIEHGCAAPHSVARLDNSVFWLGQDSYGGAIVWRSQQYAPERISTHAIEQAFGEYTLSDAVAFTYQQDGHPFYVISFPTDDRTWVYDVASGLWHERAWRDEDGLLHRQRGVVHCYDTAGRHLVGDWESGKIYRLSMTEPLDDGALIARIRTTPHISAELVRSRFNTLQVDMETGVSPADQECMALLSWSDDGGRTFSQDLAASIGALGRYRTRLRWRRLGMSRDRVYRLNITAPCTVAIVNAVGDVQRTAH